jgi:hypothetical protein
METIGFRIANQPRAYPPMPFPAIPCPVQRGKRKARVTGKYGSSAGVNVTARVPAN